ncbi:actin-related protein [Cyathus striatus]|nr:actin-related protein [Cyathus striatus]
MRKNKGPVVEELLQEQRRGSNVIIIHPGSRYTRIGRASDVTPTSVPSVVARKSRAQVSSTPRVEAILRPRKGSEPETASEPPSSDEYGVTVMSNDPFEEKLGAITVSLRDRMRFYKLRVTPNAANIASTFNEQFKPEIIPEHVDGPFRVDWVDACSTEDILIGERALQIADPVEAGYLVRWPINGATLNTRDYSSLQVTLSDIQAIIQKTLESERFQIEAQEYKNYSVVLVIPDFYDRAYVRELVNLLMVMGFKQFCVQQESLAATYGAGISNACVVDIGATVTTVACVDEGLVISDTRMTLNIGGDDITEFLYVLLQRIQFPYREADLSRTYDWNVMEDLKFRICTLAEGDVALNLYDFIVRRPNKPTEKYGLRAYDEIILAPMCIFEPRVIEFEKKRAGFRALSDGVTDEIMDHQSEYVTNAMLISTQHLMPQIPAEASVVTKKPQVSAAPTPGTATPSKTEVDSGALGEPPAAAITIDLSNDDSNEAIDVENDNKAPTQIQQVSQNESKIYRGGYAIDVCFEASKLPLDVAIFNSARAAGGDEKIRKYLQAVLVIGGTALLPGMAQALESRLQAIATPLVPNMEKVQIIPPPKEVDPRVLAWKGAAVLGKMDSVSELWVTPSDWDVLGMRGLKERCFFL